MSKVDLADEAVPPKYDLQHKTAAGRVRLDGFFVARTGTAGW